MLSSPKEEEGVRGREEREKREKPNEIFRLGEFSWAVVFACYTGALGLRLCAARVQERMKCEWGVMAHVCNPRTPEGGGLSLRTA